MLLSTSSACFVALPGAQGVFLQDDWLHLYLLICVWFFYSRPCHQEGSLLFSAASSVSSQFLARCIGISFHGGLRLHPTFPWMFHLNFIFNCSSCFGPLLSPEFF